MERFTKELCDLYVKQSLTLEASLRIMGNKAKGRVMQTANYLIRELEKGNLFSNALKLCPYISFDQIYITFILIAEHSGNLRNIIEYLNKRCIRKRENKNKLLSSVIYPLFVVILSLGVCVFLCKFLDLDKKFQIYKVVINFLIISGLIFFCITKLLGTNQMYEAFLAADQLVKGGVSISLALTCSAMVAGLDTKIGKEFLKASEKINYGMDLQRAFSFNKNFREVFYYADVSGCGSDIFEKVSLWILEKDEQRRCICMQLIEPVFIAITGVFLLIVILDFFVPVLNNMTWL